MVLKDAKFSADFKSGKVEKCWPSKRVKPNQFLISWVKIEKQQISLTSLFITLLLVNFFAIFSTISKVP
jgi:hypothetical protein